MSASMRIKAIYRGFDALLALWSSLPHSLDHTTFNPLLALFHVGLLPSLPAAFPSLFAACSPAPPTALIKGWEKVVDVASS